jgi:hypothetical protein
MSLELIVNGRFTSLSSMRAEHRELQKVYRERATSAEVLDRIECFIRFGVATGAILDAENDQTAAQGLLDLWATTLYRATGNLIDPNLEPFDKSVAPFLDETLVPYVGMDSFLEPTKNVFFGRERATAGVVARLGRIIWLR